MTRHGDSGSGAELHVVTGAFGYSGKYIAARLPCMDSVVPDWEVSVWGSWE